MRLAPGAAMAGPGRYPARPRPACLAILGAGLYPRPDAVPSARQRSSRMPQAGQQPAPDAEARRGLLLSDCWGARLTDVQCSTGSPEPLR
jgi:hypothetical protein